MKLVHAITRFVVAGLVLWFLGAIALNVLGIANDLTAMILIGGAWVLAAGEAWTWYRRELWYQKWAGTGTVCSHCGYDLRATSDRCPECGQRLPLPIFREKRNDTHNISQP